jgi:hypothetical protein
LRLSPPEIIGSALAAFASLRRDVLTDARHRCHHLRLLVARQGDKFAAAIHPGLALVAIHFERYRIDRHRFRGGILVDDLLQVRGQRIVPFLADFNGQEDRRLVGLGDVFRRVAEVHEDKWTDA